MSTRFLLCLMSLGRRLDSARGLCPGVLCSRVAMFFLLCAGSSLAVAQGSMGMQMKEMPSPDMLPAPLKMTGIGNSYLAVTASPDAQAWFEQGLNLLHDFWGYESARAFEQGIRVDPNCAMCYWGLYQALMMRGSPPSAYTEQALANAVRLKKHAGKAGQLYIEAADAGDEGAKAATSGAYPSGSKKIAILRQLVKHYPADPEAKIFLAESLHDGYDDAGEPNKGTQESITILEQVLKANPNDSAANHYWIHAMEPGAHPERALESAQKLASLAPASGHMVHMPGHIYYRVGDYAQAEHWFAASTTVDEDYMRSQHVDVDDDWNYIHNLMYAVANLMEEGKLQEAAALSNKLAGGRGQLAATLYTGSPRDGIARLDEHLPVALRTGDWPGVLTMLNASKSDANLENLTFLAKQLKELAGGMQAIQSGDLTAAQAASVNLDADLWRMSERLQNQPKKTTVTTNPAATPVMVPVMPDALPEPLVRNLAVMSLELRASILAAQKQLPDAKTLFADAAKQEKDLGYREPPTFIRPVGETEGFALLQAGDNAGAHKAYESALEERPNSGFGLYGVARSSEAAGNVAQATTEYEKFLEAWKNADANLPEVAHAREFLARQKTLAAGADATSRGPRKNAVPQG